MNPNQQAAANFKKSLEPKPLRREDQWEAFNAMKTCNPHQVAMNEMLDASKITCRDCFGFGHSVKKCPTGNNFDMFRAANQLVRSLISRYRAKLALQTKLVALNSP